MTEDEKRWLEQEIKRFGSLPALLEAMARSESKDLRTLRQEVEEGLHHPSGEDLYNYVLGWLDQEHSLRVLDHVVLCGRCLEEVMKIQQIEEALTKDALERADKLPWIERVKDFFSSLSPLYPPLRWYHLAIGVTTLAALSIVLLYPHPRSKWVAALSSVSWNHDVVENEGRFPPHREKVAFLVLLKDYKTPMSQQEIDSLYGALKPDLEDLQRYDVAEPYKVKEALVGRDSAALAVKIGAAASVQSLQSKLGVQKVVLITLAPEKNQIRVECELVDARNERWAREEAKTEATPGKLEATVRSLVYNLLNQASS